MPSSLAPRIVCGENRPHLSPSASCARPARFPTKISKFPPGWLLQSCATGADKNADSELLNMISIIIWYFHLFPALHGLLISDIPCVSIPNSFITPNSSGMSSPLFSVVPLIFWYPILWTLSFSRLATIGSPTGSIFVNLHSSPAQSLMVLYVAFLRGLLKHILIFSLFCLFTSVSASGAGFSELLINIFYCFC